MAHVHLPPEIHARYLPRSSRANAVFGAMFAVGLTSFVVRLMQDAQSAWISYVSNWLFFTSISAGAVMLAAATWITKAKWNWSVRRVSQAMVAFLPVALVLLLPMLTLREGYFPWIEMMAGDPVVQKKAAYLNIPFLIVRNLLGVGVLTGMALWFVYLALRPDMRLADTPEDHDASRKGWRARLTQGWLGQEQEEVRSYKRMTTMAPAFAAVYALALTFVSYDWAMSLEPHWFSTMFGPWFFMGGFWGGIAATILWSLYLRTQYRDVEHCVGLQVRHDLGKLAFAFTVFWTYLFFSQYIVIWYGKLPWEQAWIIHRSENGWGTYSVVTLLLCFVVPFAGLIGRKAKMKPPLLAGFATVILTGLWMERYGLVAPSLWHEGDPIFTLWHPLIGLMFLGLWLASVRWFLTTFPAVQIWQPMSDPESLEAERPAQGVAGD